MDPDSKPPLEPLLEPQEPPIHHEEHDTSKMRTHGDDVGACVLCQRPAPLGFLVDNQGNDVPGHELCAIKLDLRKAQAEAAGLTNLLGAILLVKGDMTLTMGAIERAAKENVKFRLRKDAGGGRMVFVERVHDSPIALATQMPKG